MRILISAPVLLLLLLIASAITTIDHEGNISCGDIRLELVAATAQIDGTQLTWTSAEPLHAVLVKGGPDTREYAYPAGATGDTGLTAPLMANGRLPEISHVLFCLGQYPTPVVPTVTPSETPTQPPQQPPPPPTVEEPTPTGPRVIAPGPPSGQ